MNSKRQKRPYLGVAVILMAAVVGLVMINIGPAEADRVVDAQQPAAGAPPTQTPEPAFTGTALPSLLRLASAMVIVIACIYGAIWLLRRLMGRKGGLRGNSGSLEVLETACVAPKKTVSLIRVADKAVLVGITESNMSVLTELDPEQTAALAASRPEPEPDDGFSNVLKAASDKLRLVGLKRKQTALES